MSIASSYSNSLASSSDDLTSVVELDADVQLVSRETRAVQRTKFLVFLVVVLFGVAGSVGTYLIVQEGEDDDFRTEFEAFAKEISEVSQAKVKQSFDVIGALGKTITSVSITTNDSFPFFTLPNFEPQVGEAVRISGVDAIVMAPLVAEHQRTSWEEYSVKHQRWVKQGLEHQGNANIDPGMIPEYIFAYKNKTEHVHKYGATHIEDYYMPLWQTAPAPFNASMVNFDLFTRSSFEHSVFDVLENRRISPEDDTHHAILSDACDFTYITKLSKADAGKDHPMGSYVLEPLFESFDPEAKVVAFLVSIFAWNIFYDSILQEGVNGIDVVIGDDCGDIFTYRLNGPSSRFQGKGDLHEQAYTKNKFTSDFANFLRYAGLPHAPKNGTTYDDRFQGTSKGHCKYTLDIYPTGIFYADHSDHRKAAIYASVVAGMFACILALMAAYDFLVHRRQQRLMETAKKTHTIVSDLFPKAIQERMMKDGANDKKTKKNANIFVRPGDTERKGQPLADFFPEVSVLFADIVGFTAWSSMREPSQVFILLETLYGSFDAIANRRRVFKVETVGDCYVAATGMPEHRKDHAVSLARFAQDVLDSMVKLTRDMEVTLGPDTGELSLRIGIHSGPITAGVLRGERARFQLFGDTMNVAARMESTGSRGKIQVSAETAHLLSMSGKDAWLTQREDLVVAKGKGQMSTFWLNIASKSPQSVSHSNGERSVASLENAIASTPMSNKTRRLLDWNTELLTKVLKQVVAYRQATQKSRSAELSLLSPSSSNNAKGKIPADEVAEVIELPQYNATASAGQKDNSAELELDAVVLDQLHRLITSIAFTYRDNPFHNFEHAAHVTQSVSKLLSRIVAPASLEQRGHTYTSTERNGHDLHDHTYGITSDPLTQFACIFSALIHDVDHNGVPNTTLVKEDSPVACMYNGRSVAEQNSIELSWSLLMQDDYEDLKQALIPTQSEQKRFRQLVVNCVMATDIMDRELKAARNARWAKAFSEQHKLLSKDEIRNCKATIVIEHLIQASDVAHTMQHWHIYRKWNQKLFAEMVKAYEEGRAATNPAENWYQGEIGFFDFYIIPLAKKLKDCGVFGVSSDEYLNYAKKNREEWAAKGKAIVSEMMNNLSAK